VLAVLQLLLKHILNKIRHEVSNSYNTAGSSDSMHSINGLERQWRVRNSITSKTGFSEQLSRITKVLSIIKAESQNIDSLRSNI